MAPCANQIQTYFLLPKAHLWYLIWLPISSPPHLSQTFITKNLTSMLYNPDFSFSTVTQEAALGCLDGPFSAEAHAMVKGHFGLHLLEWLKNRLLDPSLPLICHHSKADFNGYFTNGWLGAFEFSTRNCSAAHHGDFTSLLSFSPLAIVHLQYVFFSHLSLLCFHSDSHILCIKKQYYDPINTYLLATRKLPAVTAEDTIALFRVRLSHLWHWKHGLTGYFAGGTESHREGQWL